MDIILKGMWISAATVGYGLLWWYAITLIMGFDRSRTERCLGVAVAWLAMTITYIVTAAAALPQ